ncbi:MAG: phage terminase large subunit [Armatimonadota bacterium]
MAEAKGTGRRRRKAAGPPTFREFVQAVWPRYRWYRHCDALAAVLQRLADGEVKRLMVFMPPRHGKSETVSRLFPAYYLLRFPERWVGLCSYGAELAHTLSRSAKDYYLRGGGRLDPGAAAARHWETGAGGGMWAAGVGGPITGKGWHLGVIDDPVKNAAEVGSPHFREKQWEWYGSVFYTREEPVGESGDPDGALVVVQTRWHPDDLSGRLLARDRDEEEPERWHVVSLEALKEETPPEVPPHCTLEPDWRAPGEALCPERRPREKLERVRRALGSYAWNALYQQRPRPRSGGFFKVDRLQVVAAAPAEAERVRYWDKASTEGDGDYTAGVLLAKDGDGLYYVEDVVRGRWGPAERDRRMRQAAERDAARAGSRVRIWVEQEPGSGGKESAQASVRLLEGFPCRTERATGDKQSRADPFAAQVEAGRVRLVEGAWNSPYREELAAFPLGEHDDQVDASSGAFNRLAGRGRRRGLVGSGRGLVWVGVPFGPGTLPSGGLLCL